LTTRLSAGSAALSPYTTLFRSTDRYGQRAMGHCRSTHSHTLPHHDSAGATVEHYPGAYPPGLDFQLAEHGHEAHPLGAGDRRPCRHPSSIQRRGGILAEHPVNALDDAGHRLEARLAQVEHDLRPLGKVRGNTPLYGRAGRNQTRVGTVDGH